MLVDRRMNLGNQRRSRVRTYAWCGRGHEDQAAQVGGTLVAERTGSVDQGTDTIGLDGAADKGAAPGGGGRGGLLRLEEFLLGVGGLSAVVGVTEQRAENGERGGVVEESAEGDGRGLDGWEVCCDVQPLARLRFSVR